MAKKLLVTGIFLCLVAGCATMPATSRADDNDKELVKNWQLVTDAARTAPDAQDTIDKLDSFTARWKDSNKLEASKAAYLKGELLYKSKKYGASFDAFKKLTDDFSNSPYADSAMYKMGEALYNQAKYTDAIEQLSKFRFKYSNSLFIMESVYGISLSYLNLKEYKKADRELADFLGKYSYYGKDENIKFIGGLIDFYLERYDAAIEKLKVIRNDAAYYYLGHALLKESKYPDAAEAFKKVGIGDRQSKYLESALYNKGEAFFKGINYPSATEAYQAFIQQFPNSPLLPYAVYKKGASLFLDKKYDQAYAVYKAVMNGSGDKTVRAFASYLAGECQLKMKKYAEALVSYEALMNTYPDIYDAYASGLVKAGWCYVALGKYDKAEQVLTKFVGQFTTHESIALGYYLLGISYYNRQQYGSAVESFKYILDKQKYTDLTEAAVLMTELCYFNQGQYALLINEASSTLNTLSEKFTSPISKIRSRSYYYLGTAYMKSGMYGLAARSFQEIIDKYYDSDIVNEARANLAWCFYQVENYRGARTMAKDVLSAANVPLQAKKACEILIAHSYFSEKEFDKASQKYGEFAYAHEKDKDFEMTAEALFQQGKVYEAQEYYNDALKSWEYLAYKFPKSKRAPEAIYKRGDIFFKAQQYDKALASFQEILTKYPKDVIAEDAMLSMAEVFYNSDNEAKAVEWYKKFMDKYPDSNKVTSVEEGMQRATYRKAEKKGDPKALLEFYDKYPNSNMAVNAVYKAAEIYYTENKFKESIDAFGKVIQYFPNDSLATNAQYYIGACYEALQKMDEAVAAYKTFIKNYPKHELAKDVTFRLATAAYMAKNYPDAIFYYERILEKYPGTEYEQNAAYNVALAYSDTGKQDDAIAAYKRYVRMFPKDPKSKDIPTMIGGIYLEQKRYKDAIAAYEEVAASPASEDAAKAEAIYRAGDIYAQLEQNDKAIESLMKLKDAKPADSVFRVSGLITLAGLLEEKKDWVGAAGIYDIVAVSGGQKDYVDGARQRGADIRNAYPDLFKKPEPAPETKPDAGAKPAGK